MNPYTLKTDYQDGRQRWRDVRRPQYRCLFSSSLDVRPLDAATLRLFAQIRDTTNTNAFAEIMRDHVDARPSLRAEIDQELRTIREGRNGR